MTIVILVATAIGVALVQPHSISSRRWTTQTGLVVASPSSRQVMRSLLIFGRSSSQVDPRTISEATTTGPQIHRCDSASSNRGMCVVGSMARDVGQHHVRQRLLATVNASLLA